MSAYIWLCALLPPVKQMKELTWRRKKGENLSFLPALGSTLISPCHYVYLCFWVCPSLSLAVKLSDGAGLSGIDHDERLQALSTDGGVHDSFAQGHGRALSIRHAVYLLDNGRKVWEEQRGKEGGWGKTYLSTGPLSLPLPIPTLASGAHTKPEIMIAISENSLEIILLDWSNVLRWVGTGVKGKETAI